MKKLLLSIFTVASLAVSAGTEVTATDLKLTTGNEWYMKVTGGKAIGDFTSTGTGVSWDFTSYEASSSNDTVKVQAPTLTGDIKVSSNIISETHYNVTASDILMTAINANDNDYPFNSPASSGFPHNSTSTWNSGTTIPSAFGNIPATVSGSVLAEGTITTSFGTYNAVLVEETFDVPTLYTETFYYWETKEFGRMAVLRGSSFMLMTQNNFSPVSTAEATIESLNIFPNPATANFSVKADGLEKVEVYNTIGS